MENEMKEGNENVQDLKEENPSDQQQDEEEPQEELLFMGLPLKGKDINKAIIHVAQDGCVKDFLRLLSAGANAHYKDKFNMTSVDYAIGLGHVELVKAMIAAGVVSLDNAGPGSPVLLAASRGHEDVLAVLLEAGASPEARNYDFETPVYIAASKGHAKCINVLAAAGADINATELDQGDTPLHQSVFRNHVQSTQALVSLGANGRAQNNFGDTPLHVAVWRDNPKIVRILVQERAGVHIRNEDGDTPLHQAAAFNAVNSVRGLLSVGVNTNIRNNWGQKPIDLGKSPVIKRMLRTFDQ